MRKTLLEIVQSTLGSMDSDVVSSIGETVESEQIAITAQEQFYELATYQRIPQFEHLTQLLGLSDTTKPTVMKIPVNATDIKDVRYKHTDSNGRTSFREVRFLDKETFLHQQLDLKVGDPKVGESVIEGSIRIPYRNDTGPTTWTTFDDENLVFDAVDTVTQGDDTLFSSNSLVLAYIIPEFELTDGFVPDLPIKLFPQYMNMIKEVNSYEQRQIPNEVRSRRAEREGHRNRHFAAITDGSDQGYSKPRTYGRFNGNGRNNGRGFFR
jgi:hypothetical protein